MLKIGLTTVFTVVVIPLFAVGYNAINRITVIEEKIKRRTEVSYDIKEDIRELKQDFKEFRKDIKELIKRR